MNSIPVKAVTFDAGGTLIHLREPVGATYSRIALQFGISASPSDLETSFRAVWKRSPPPFATPDKVDEENWWKHVVRSVFELATGTPKFTSPENFDQFFTRLYECFAEPGAWELDLAAVEVLDQLEDKGLKLAIISNFDERLHRIFHDLGVQDRFDPIVISNEIQASKPDTRIFEHAISSIDIPASQILHVGDDPVCDVQGAEAAGMQALLVGRKGQSLKQIIEKLPLAKV